MISVICGLKVFLQKKYILMEHIPSFTGENLGCLSVLPHSHGNHILYIMKKLDFSLYQA